MLSGIFCLFLSTMLLLPPGICENTEIVYSGLDLQYHNRSYSHAVGTDFDDYDHISERVSRIFCLQKPSNQPLLEFFIGTLLLGMT